ncbi:AAA family ATPase [Engelhardtia mirabilis]|uniref:ATPase RavA n=1 Tax=Engelhardtia mirabilis TaxID=2528011 RepID=A0A518BNA4_9BACT|nr:ATPase RavA [Planctomycetes bacterium Pla133]QDV02761.1 ATPase RavA [Planctomycetes bacterium Pla86]
MAPTQAQLDADTIQRGSAWTRDLTDALGRVVVGQEHLVRSLLIGLLTGGHVLLEGVPGLAKSLAVSTLARAVGGDFARLQFTPDLLPSDLVGTEVYHARDGSFAPRKGPIFANFILADEINRAPAKVQSALLEAMQERQVSIGGETFPLPRPFLVLATQNPLEQEGTYALPEAQLDRFALKVVLDYPRQDEELVILDRMASTAEPIEVTPVTSPEAVLATRPLVDAVTLDPRLREYIVRLVHATRRPAEAGLSELAGMIEYGASPRGTIVLALTCKAEALLEGRDYVTPTDIKRVAPDVLRHRVAPTYEAEASGFDSDALVRRVLETVPVP